MTNENQTRTAWQQIVDLLLPHVATIRERIDIVNASWGPQAKIQYEIDYEGSARQFATRFVAQSLKLGREIGDRDTAALELVLVYLHERVGQEQQKQIDQLLSDLRHNEDDILSLGIPDTGQGTAGVNSSAAQYHQSGQTVEGPQVNAGGDVHIDTLGNKVDTGGGTYVAGDIIYQAPAEKEKPLQPFEPKTVQIPAGTCVMSSRAAKSRQVEQFDVELPSFLITVQPVSNSEYHYYLQQTNQSAPPELLWELGTTPSTAQEAQPVQGVTWYEALAYCEWLAGESGRDYTLPTEAQWARIAGLDGDPLAVAHGIREWTTTLWGEKRRRPDPRYGLPWRPNDGRDNLKANDQIRRVTRGGARGPSSRSSELPNSRGLSNKRIGFRIVINQEV